VESMISGMRAALEKRTLVMSPFERQQLLQLARGAIVAHFAGAPRPEFADLHVAAQPGAAFVTLNCDRKLRGCIGHIDADQPLGETIVRCAVAAATCDPRFRSIAPNELSSVRIELSLLAEREPIDGPEDVEVGVHGLLVELGARRGLLLPQVATEWSWDRETFLAHTCRKAGLPPDAWRNGAKAWRFAAEVFHE
jgi:AmmeMemoRadiSam system protein A